MIRTENFWIVSAQIWTNQIDFLDVIDRLTPYMQFYNIYGYILIGDHHTNKQNSFQSN